MKSIKIMAAAIALCGMTACGDNTPKTFTGFITDASMNTVTVENAEGTFTFSTMDADKSEANGLLLGARSSWTTKASWRTAPQPLKSHRPDLCRSRRQMDHADPINPEGVMGIDILIEGQAQSINMATLRYTSWELQGEAGKILLKGQSVGNGQTIDFTETGIIAKGRRRRIHADHRGQQDGLHQSDQIARPLYAAKAYPRPRKGRGFFTHPDDGRNLANRFKFLNLYPPILPKP